MSETKSIEFVEKKKKYYYQHYPVDYLCNWLNIHQFEHREIAFMKNDKYIRYNSFENAYDFNLELVKINPSKFDIGPVYDKKPKYYKLNSEIIMNVTGKELVFDVDINDYNDFRRCCTNNNICVNVGHYWLAESKY